MSETRVLVIDDDDDIRGLVTTLLERGGITVHNAPNGREGLREFHSWRPDLVVLDVSMPELDGWNVLDRIRDMSEVPVLMLTARGDELERVRGLQAGADDYVVKPFGLRELIARIRAVTRRGRGGTDAGPLRVGELEVDERARRARIGERELDLTPKEFDLLAALARDPGAVVHRRRLLEEVWETNWYGSTKTIDVHVAALRRKLGDAGLIETVRGIGFRLRT